MLAHQCTQAWRPVAHIGEWMIQSSTGVTAHTDSAGIDIAMITSLRGGIVL